jgi:hypothetical protein
MCTSVMKGTVQRGGEGCRSKLLRTGQMFTDNQTTIFCPKIVQNCSQLFRVVLNCYENTLSDRSITLETKRSCSEYETTCKMSSTSALCFVL